MVTYCAAPYTPTFSLAVAMVVSMLLSIERELSGYVPATYGGWLNVEFASKAFTCSSYFDKPAAI